MKRIFFTGMVLTGMLSISSADQFRIREKRTSGTADVFYATIRISKAGHQVFTGRTDKYGRIEITLSNGEYDAAVTMGKTTKTVHLVLDGGKKLKVVFLP